MWQSCKIVFVISLILIVTDILTAQDSLADCTELSYEFTYSAGGDDTDNAYAVLQAQFGANVVVGDFEDSVDFDPGTSIDMHIASGGCDVFVTYINPDGSYGWTRTFGGPDGGDTAYGVAKGNANSLYIVGAFYNTVDFDPSDSVDEHVSVGQWDAFLMKLSEAGEYLWTVTYGSEQSEGAHGVTTDDLGNAYLVGDFSETADFDPSETGEDLRVSNGGPDVFLTKVSPEGTEIWALTLGGLESDWPNAIRRIGTNVYVAGEFSDTVDFDPGPAVDEHSAVGGRDAFVSKFTTEGEYVWTWSAGGSGVDQANDVAIALDGGVYVTGAFTGTVDFDPGEGVDEFVSNGTYDAFVTRLESGGTYGWTHVFGGTDFDFGQGVSVREDDTVFVAGSIGSTSAPVGYAVDFNPGESDIHLGNGGMDMFVMALGIDGSYQWTHTAGGTATDRAWAIDASGEKILIGGSFSTSFDPDPTDGVDIHSSNGFTDAFLTSLACTDEPAPCDGDVNADSIVDPLDSGYVLSRFNCPVGQGDPLCDAADANLDGLVDPLDVGYVMSRFGECI